MFPQLLLSLACAPQTVPAPEAEPESTPPNFLIILVDDLGYGDLGADLAGIGGREKHRTPHISRLAAEGLVLTQGYSAAPNCAPSRASLQTGRLTPRHGIYTVGTAARGKPHQRELVPVPNTTVLADEELTLAEHLGAAGYSSAHLGKWHLGPDPTAQGYDVNVAGNKAGHPKSYFSPYKNADLEDGDEGEYLTTRLTDEAIGLVGELKRPFLMHLAYYSVHTPLQAPAERVEERRAAGAKSAKYAAMVEALDHEVGRLLAALDEADLTEDTLVIFTSDNGPWLPYGLQGGSAGLLRDGKGTNWEGGQRVPCVMSWPARLPAGVTMRTPMNTMDLLPTIASWTGASLPVHEIDGVDVGAALAGDPEAAAALEARPFVYFTSRGALAGVRRGPWKLKLPEGMLFDVERDPSESKDMAAREPELVKELEELATELAAGIEGSVRPRREGAPRVFDPERPNPKG